MSINNNNTACANSVSVALVIFLLLSQMNNSVSGKPLLPKSQEEKLSYFHSTDPDNYTHLIMERQLVKRAPSDEDSSGHVSEALKPLLRLIRIQNLNGDDTAVDYSDPRIRMRFGKRSSTDNYSSSFMD